MSLTEREKTYLRAAVQNASPSGLVVILFDMLIGDLERVIAAVAAHDVEKRSSELKHAFLILQQLEGSLDTKNGGEAAKNFARFYALIRSKLLEAHIKISSDIVRRQIELLLDVRQAWQQSNRLSPSAAQSSPLATEGSAAQAVPTHERATTTNWTA
ncbi:MAG TPA: flagellar export chaperone FliS [Terriglobales bacterium]|nr:flagellar export chaperone FliS [Terriglobales bacterium]